MTRKYKFNMNLGTTNKFIYILIFINPLFGLTQNYIDLLKFLGTVRQVQTYDNYTVRQLSNLRSVQSQHYLIKRQARDDTVMQINKHLCKTPEQKIGYCQHVEFCHIPELTNDIWKLIGHMCIINGSSIGICCPQQTSQRIGLKIISNVRNDELHHASILNNPKMRGCGTTTKQFPRIIDGRPVENDEWPWMAAILRSGYPFVWCGGTLISDRLVLTAAHCVYGLQMNQFFVRLGEYNTHELNETRARDFRIENMTIHLDYDPLTFANDIALIRLERSALLNTYIWPVCMPPIDENWEGTIGIVTGWGTKTFGGPHSDILMEVSVPIWYTEDCRKVLVERISDDILCAGLPTGGQDSCQGDSGGPLLVQLPNMKWITIGIVSWGIRCGEPNRPGIYTRIDRFLSWIIDQSSI